jgi:hypothetical protein
VFEVCRHGCRFQTIQRAVNAAGSFQFKRRHRARVRAVVAVRPGRYPEGVVVDGTLKHKRFDGLTIEGTRENPRRVLLDGGRARRGPAAAQNGIEAIGVEGIVLRNMWARDYPSSGFLLRAPGRGTRPCETYRMENLFASGNGSYGLSAEGCLGGRMVESVAYRQGDAAFHVGETPCDRKTWSDHGVGPRRCQREARWTLLREDRGYESGLGYSGTNSKYVKVVDSAFYDNGAGIAIATLDGAAYEPAGWTVLERNLVFWNNYNRYLSGSGLPTGQGVLGQLNGAPLSYPTGVGVLLYGAANAFVRNNDVFGNYKWGIASVSAPGEAFVANVGDEGKSINNQIVENRMGREGADPNGEYDLWNDASGGGNCWGGNSPGATLAPGDGEVSRSRIYPPCPQTEVVADEVGGLDLTAGLQIDPGEPSDPKTLFGYASSNPPQDQQCSWVRRGAGHPPFQRFRPVEVPPLPGELACG